MQLLAVLVLWISTMAVVVVDRRMRDSRRDDDLLPMDEPGLGSLIAIAVLFNVACLPYYFFRTRRSVLGLLMGVGFFIVCFVLTVGSSVALASFDHR